MRAMNSASSSRARAANHHIYRIDTEARGRRAWFVIIQRNGRRVTKLFYDGSHAGGRKGALAAARAWRDAVLAGAPEDDRSAQLRLVVRRNSKSGVPGVIRYAPKKEKRAPCWIARWEEPGVGQRSRRFSIATHGEEGAYELALAARRAALERLGFIDEDATLKRKPLTKVAADGDRQTVRVGLKKNVAPAAAIAALSSKRPPRR